MTPQLQQAIRLLQLSTLELQQEIQEALDANPLLEMDDDHDNPTPLAELPTNKLNDHNSGDNDGDAGGEDFEFGDSHSDHDSTLETGDALNRDQVNDDLPMDMSWDEMVSAPGKNGAAVGMINMLLYMLVIVFQWGTGLVLDLFPSSAVPGAYTQAGYQIGFGIIVLLQGYLFYLITKVKTFR